MIKFIDTKKPLEVHQDIIFYLRVNPRTGKIVNRWENSNTSNGESASRSSFAQQKTSMKIFFVLFVQKLLSSSFSKYFVPLIMTRRRGPRVILVLVTIFSACLTVSLLPELEIGLEQELSVPSDSNIAKYFRDQRINSKSVPRFISCSKHWKIHACSFSQLNNNNNN